MPTFSSRAVPVNNPSDTATDGTSYNTGRGPVSVTAGNSLRILGVNPVGSNVVVLLDRFRVWASTTSEDVEIRINPTGNLPTFSVPYSNVRLGGPAGVLIVTCDVGTPMTGGSTAAYKLPIAEGNSQNFTDYLLTSPFVVPEGFSIGASATNISGGPSTMTMVVDMRETPAR